MDDYYLQEEDDDAFYHELRRQVLQLTDEEEEDDDGLHASVTKVLNMKVGAAKARCYYDWTGNREDYCAPAWIVKLWRTGNGVGTGVFIPQMTADVQPTRKTTRSRRRSERAGRTYRRVEKMK